MGKKLEGRILVMPGGSFEDNCSNRKFYSEIPSFSTSCGQKFGEEEIKLQCLKKKKKKKPSKSSNKWVKVIFCIAICSSKIQRPTKPTQCFVCLKKKKEEVWGSNNIFFTLEGDIPVFPSPLIPENFTNMASSWISTGLFFHFLVEWGHHLWNVPSLAHKTQLASI